MYFSLLYLIFYVWTTVVFRRELLILGGSDCGDHFKKFYLDDKNYTVAELWRIFSNCSGSDFHVLPRNIKRPLENPDDSFIQGRISLTFTAMMVPVG